MRARFLHLTDCLLSPALTCGAEPGQGLKLCGSTSPPAETKQSQSLTSTSQDAVSWRSFKSYLDPSHLTPHNQLFLFLSTDVKNVSKISFSSQQTEQQGLVMFVLLMIYRSKKRKLCC